jgi:hypothetical protein
LCTGDDSPNGFVYDAVDQVRHDLLSPLTTISAHAQLLTRDLRRSPSLTENERVKMLARITAIEAEVRALCAVIDAIGNRRLDPADRER